MNEDLLQQAMGLFETNEKWTAFWELHLKAGDISQRWWKKLQIEVYTREKKENNPDWDICIWNNWDIGWFIRGVSINSLLIHFWGNSFSVCQVFGYLDVNKVNEYIKDSRFDAIKCCFDRVDGSDRDNIAKEKGNFHFGTKMDGYFPSADHLSWIAGNKTTEFADQIIAKVRKFQTPEITALFTEINERCKSE